MLKDSGLGWYTGQPDKIILQKFIIVASLPSTVITQPDVMEVMYEKPQTIDATLLHEVSKKNHGIYRAGNTFAAQNFN